MLSQVKKVRTSNVCVVKANPIQVTQRSVDELNRKIEKDIMKNESRREKGLEVAVSCRDRKSVV